MNVRLSQSLVAKNKKLRLAIGLLIILTLLYLFNADVLINHPFYIFVLFVLPHGFYCLLYFSLFHNLWHWIPFIRASITLLVLFSTFWTVKYYYYVLLPIQGIVFFSDWKVGDEWALIKKIVKATLAIAAWIGIDYYYWEKYRVKRESTRLENRLDEINNNHLLSGHFLRRLYELTRRDKLKLSVKSLDFFQYVTNRMYSSKTRVALEEEWKYVEILCGICTDRRFVITGTDGIKPGIWNRSVPSLAIMTWIENAIEYSPDSLELPITLSWKVMPDGIQLQIKNHIGSNKLSQGTGKGLQLVDRLFDAFKSDDVFLSYAVVEDSFFIVTLHFKIYSYA